MSNFLEDIEKRAPEKIISIVISDNEYGNRFDDVESPKYIHPSYLNRVLKWEEAKEFLNYKYSTSYGGQDCHSVTMWTENFIGFVGEYDGSTWIEWLPRHPIDHVARAI